VALRACAQHGRRASLNQGIDYFQRALERDPKYAFAYAGVADSYSLLAYYSYAPRKETSELAEAAAQKAIAGDPSRFPLRHTSIRTLIGPYWRPRAHWHPNRRALLPSWRA